MADWQIRNPSWTRGAVIAHFGDEGPHAEFYRMLHAVNRDLFLNSGYSRAGRHWSRKSQMRLVNRLLARLARKGPRPIRLLDVGCGRGGPAFLAHDRWEADVVGIDICPYNIERAIQRTRQESIPQGLHFRQGDGTNLPFPENEFPYIMSIESAAYMPEKGDFLAEVGRVLSPGGRFAMAAISMDEDAAGNSRYALDCLGRFLAAWDMPYIESLAGYSDLIRKAGLESLREEDATRRTLIPHGKRLHRLVRLWETRAFYRASAWYVKRRTGANLDLIREQIEATCEAIESGVLRYGLFWAEKVEA